MYNLKWQKRFIELSKHIATWSKDPSTKVGAVIVDDEKKVIGIGYNGFPRGVEDTEERYLDRETKLKFVCHAERNALDNALTDVKGCSIFTPLMPCNECAKSIIQRGIKHVYTLPYDIKEERFNWKESEKMFKEANVNLTLVI